MGKPEQPGRVREGLAARLLVGELLFASRRTFGVLGPSAPDRSLKFADLMEEAARFAEPSAATACALVDRRQAGRDVDGEATSRTVQIGHKRTRVDHLRGPQTAAITAVASLSW
jgi:hypothetical protein